MSHAFFKKYTVTLTSPIIFGNVSTHAASAVWGGSSGTKPGVIGPTAPVGTSTSIPATTTGPVDPNYPNDPEPDQTNQTPVQTVEDGDNVNTSTVVSRNVALTFEVPGPSGDYPEGTTTGIVIPAWATGDVSTNTRAICTTCTVNGQPAGIIFDETIGVTGWHITGLDSIPDGTPLDIQIKGTSQTLSPVDAFGNRDTGTASDFTLSLSGVASGGGATGTMDGALNGRWDVHDAENGAEGAGPGVSDEGGPGGIVPSGSYVVGPVAPDPNRTTQTDYLGLYFRFGYPNATKYLSRSDGGIIIEEGETNWPVPGNNSYVWSAIFTDQYDGDGNPIYTEGWVWQPFFSVWGRVYQWYYEGGTADPTSPDYVPLDLGDIDLGGPIWTEDTGSFHLPGTPKDGYVTGSDSDAPNYNPNTETPGAVINPDITEPRTVPLQPDTSSAPPVGNDLPMDEFPLTKDLVIHTTVAGNAPTETTAAPDGKEVLLDYTGFTFVSGTSFQIDETVRFKYLPLKARVEDQPATTNGFYTPVVGPFTGARFRELVGDTNAKVELYWAGPQQPFFLFRKMPTRATLATSTVSFKDMQTEEASRDVTINWTVDLPVPFGLGYKFDSASEPGRILLRKMQSPAEPHMETSLNMTRYDFEALPQISWQYDQPYKSRDSNGGNSLVWNTTVSHTISFSD